MSIKVMHPGGEVVSYSRLPSLSELMLARDDPTKYRIRFVDGDPVIEDVKPKPPKRPARSACTSKRRKP